MCAVGYARRVLINHRFMALLRCQRALYSHTSSTSQCRPELTSRAPLARSSRFTGTTSRILASLPGLRLVLVAPAVRRL